jgi:hypothetical protein
MTAVHSVAILVAPTFAVDLENMADLRHVRALRLLRHSAEAAALERDRPVRETTRTAR